jgi:hypothetical protein
MLASAKTAPAGVAGAALLGFSMGGESDVTPYLLARYYGLRSLATLCGFNWTAYAISAAAGSILLGRAFDRTGFYQAQLVELSVLMLLAGVLMTALPRYGAITTDRLPEHEGICQAEATKAFPGVQVS